MDNSHKTIPVKVNALVDEGVAPLVNALNEFPAVLTVDSCQGHNGDPAYVFFHYVGEDGGPRFAQWLNKGLHEVAEGTDYVLQLEWRPGHPDPMAQLCVPGVQVDRLASLVSQLASAYRKNGSDGDTSCKAPHNSTDRQSRLRSEPSYGGTLPSAA